MGDFRAWLIDNQKTPLFGYHLQGCRFDIGICEQLEAAKRFYNGIKEI